MHQTRRTSHKYVDPSCRSLAGNAGSNPVRDGMNVYFECRMLSVRGLSVGLIIRLEGSYRDSWV